MRNIICVSSKILHLCKCVINNMIQTLRHILLPSFCVAILANIGSAETFLIKNNPDTPLNWDDKIWSTGSYSDAVASEYIPGYYDESSGIDTRDAVLMFPGGSCNANMVLNVNGDYTISRIDHEHGQYGVTMDMAGMLDSGAKDSSITIKALDPSAETYDFIVVGSAVKYEEGKHELSYTAFNGGTVKLTGLNDGGIAQIKVYCNNSSTSDLISPNSLIFSETTTFISESDLKFIGDTSSSTDPKNLQSTVDLNGTTIIGSNSGTDENPEWAYKDMTIGNSTSSVQGNSLTVNVGGNLTANSLTQNVKTVVNLSGNMDLVAPLTDSWNVSNAASNFAALKILGSFVVKDGGSLNLSGLSGSATNGAIYVGAGGSFVLESGAEVRLDNAALRSTAYSSSTAANIDVQSGSELSAAAFWLGDNTQISVAGKVDVSSSSGIYSYGKNTVFTVKNGADISSRNISLAYSTMVVESDVAAGSIKTNYIGLDNNNARLQLYASNAVVNQTTLKSDDVYFQAYIGECYLDIFADQTFDSLRFLNQQKRDGITSIDFNVYIGDAVNLISLNTLSNNTLITPEENYLERYLIFDNFRNELIHVDSIDTTLDLSLISSADGDWVDFRFEADELNGGYWLTATYVPEPSSYAVIFGAFAMGLAFYFRRK